MPDGPRFRFRAKAWVWQGPAAWHFVSLPKGLSRQLKRLFGGQRPGFGSIPVEASAGGTAWKTSIFPDSRRGAYLLPLKKEVRAKAGLQPGRTAEYELKVLA